MRKDSAGKSERSIFMKTNDRYYFYFKLALVTVAAAMVLYELFYCDHFIGYMDGKYYYQYLPEFFIERNFSFYVKFPMGTALCELPFFLVAHLLTLWLSPGNVTGYGGFYEYAVGFCGIFFFLVGCVLLFKVLRELFESKNALFTMLLLIVGTPLGLYATKYASFSHVYTFAMGSALLFFILRMDADPKREMGYAFLTGLVAGWIFILRNVNIVFLLIYLLYDFGSGRRWTDHLAKVFSLRRLPFHIIGGLVLVLPQCLYWKRTTGSFLLNTYADERFAYLGEPKILEVLFSDAKGYFIFTPLMILAVLGWFFMRRTKAKSFRFGVPLLFFYILCITSTWWCWWLGGVYSIRVFLDILPFMALSLGAFMACLDYWIRQKSGMEKRVYTGIYVICILFFVYVNLALLAGAQRGIVNETFSNWWELRRAIFHWI